jgi:hypothetical protein
MKYLYAAGAFLITSSAALAATSSVTGPSGHPVYTTTCKSDQQECYQEAAQYCRGPYQILSSHSRAGGLIIDLGFPGPATYYSMSYRCGASDGRLAGFPRRGPEWNPPRPAYVNCDVNPYNVQCYGYH